MQIIIGRIVGGEYKSGVSSKSGKPYSICNISVSGAKNSVFESMPTKITIPADIVDSVRSRLSTVKPGDEFSCVVENQSRNDGPDQIIFKDFFQFQPATAK